LRNVLNLARCEAHLDVMKYIIKKYLDED